MQEMNRRSFIKTTAAVSLGAIASQIGTRAFAAGDDKIRIGVIGCGGRGTDAVRNCIESSESVELVAMADLFKDRLDDSFKSLKMGTPDNKVAPLKGFNVSPDQCFVGFDAYQKLLACKLDMVLLTAPPYTRPIHLKAAIEAGKHVFMEKPAGVDPAGIRSVIQTAELADQKKLSIVAGTQRRHQKHYLDLMNKVQEGALGEIMSAQCYWCGGDMLNYWNWFDRAKMPNDMEWQCRNWPWFLWTSGDHIVEQHVHNIDVINWALRGHPVKAYGMGGRAVRKNGNIYDHFAVEFEYPKGIKATSMCRQMPGCTERVSENVKGTKGFCYTDGATGYIKGENAYRYEGTNPNPYVVEHTDLIQSIRDGKPLNEAKRVAESTLTGIMGRMSTYTGREISWDWVMNASKLDLVPAKLDFAGELPAEPVASPGKTQLI
jgi:myo-inositol 2-dehydrogenase / D-chiro-inositol 1-dehydrogenase